MALLDGDPGQECQFPLFSKEAGFRDGGLRSMKEIKTPAARSLIEYVQPFNQKGASPWLRRALNVLHDISNQDKHRVVALTLVNLRALGSMTTRATPFLGPHRGRAKLLRGPLDLTDDDMKVETHPQLYLDMEGGDPNASLSQTMDYCARDVRVVLSLAAHHIFVGPPDPDLSIPFGMGWRPTGADEV